MFVIEDGYCNFLIVTVTAVESQPSPESAAPPPPPPPPPLSQAGGLDICSELLSEKGVGNSSAKKSFKPSRPSIEIFGSTNTKKECVLMSDVQTTASANHKMADKPSKKTTPSFSFSISSQCSRKESNSIVSRLSISKKTSLLQRSKASMCLLSTSEEPQLQEQELLAAATARGAIYTGNSSKNKKQKNRPPPLILLPPLSAEYTSPLLGDNGKTTNIVTIPISLSFPFSLALFLSSTSAQSTHPTAASWSPPSASSPDPHSTTSSPHPSAPSCLPGS